MARPDSRREFTYSPAARGREPFTLKVRHSTLPGPEAPGAPGLKSLMRSNARSCRRMDFFEAATPSLRAEAGRRFLVESTKATQVHPELGNGQRGLSRRAGRFPFRSEPSKLIGGKVHGDNRR